MTYEIKARLPAAPPQHYTPCGKIGFPQGIRCWCGEKLEFAYHEANMKAKREAFFALHDDCAAQRVRGAA